MIVAVQLADLAGERAAHRHPVEELDALGAGKLIYLTTEPGVTQGGALMRQLSVEEAETRLARPWRGM